MATFNFNSINAALTDPNQPESGVDFSGKSLKLDTEKDAQPIIDAINKCPNLVYLTLTGNTLGVKAAQAIAKALENHPELKVARFSDMFTGRMKTEIPPALMALGDGMIAAGARLTVLDLSDNAFGPIGVEGLAKLLQSDVCSEIEELRLNNNGLGITGGRLLASALKQRRRRLKIFVAGRNRLENDGAKALAQVFQEMGTLEEVAMPQNGIYHVGISALSTAFKSNPRLSRLNLNDNTIGAKGARAVADALPHLKNLRCINFGDCLLKSKGACALAKALKDNSPLLESLDLSHNEIGRAACLEVVEALTVLPDSGERLSRVVLAGNSLGGSADKKVLRDKLGACAELSDGEGSDNEYVTDSDEDNSEAEEDTEGESEDSATEDAQHQDTSVDVKELILDTSGSDDVQDSVERFLLNPTIENFDRIGDNAAEVIDAYLQRTCEAASLPRQYACAALAAGSLARRSAGARAAARALLARLTRSAGELRWPVADALLVGLGLIKSENKDFKIRWSVGECYSSVAEVLQEPYFPASVRDTLRYFIASKLPTLPADVREEIQRHPALFS
ncbi:ran GTPase-activating protein 1 isoform X2 [Manduca sexta]|uniref:ran GTPase-activating protein 1 isoform X2 n=1 Tax=Manduca sexta TaxID=7130 RepID=UPI00118453B6|nr:ran GTPase-activating protein 1 isoform X2 [Manduca sexta]